MTDGSYGGWNNNKIGCFGCGLLEDVELVIYTVPMLVIEGRA